MNYWFLCKVSYTKELEDGTVKRMKDNYLTDATTLTEAEARMHEEVGRSMRGEFSVAAANRMNFVDVFTYPNVDNYYKCKIRYVTIDETKGKEREVKNQVLIAANDLLDAHTRLTKEFASMLVPYEIIEIIKTPLVEVFRYKSPDERVTPNLRPISEIEEIED
ncbi:MAG: hypothetical protein COZ18_15845 [Flexibacter sp. CG_4_10_14_3_um_filter_32_15]|nr:MAG: hypothetical protein COZ18_15845 [Flexibacter sp. CG_4_10_14_3_um_filter_32_15]